MLLCGVGGFRKDSLTDVTVIKKQLNQEGIVYEKFGILFVVLNIRICFLGFCYF